MNLFRGLSAMSLVALVACGAPVSGAGDAGQIDAGQIDAGQIDAGQIDAGQVDSGQPDGGPGDSGVLPLDAGTPCVDTGTCAVNWLELGSFPVNVDHHTTFIHTDPTGTWIYAVGGVNNFGDTLISVWDVVRRAKIESNGFPGAWETLTTKLPRPRGFHAMAVSGNVVVLLGGLSTDSKGPYATDSVDIGTLDDQGLLSWKTGPSLGYAALHPTAAVVGNTVVIAGGTGAGNQPQALVKTATLNTDGTLSAWTLGTALPTGRSHHASVVRDGHMYLLGGFNPTQQPLPDVLRSHHDTAGAIDGWDVVGTLPDAPWTSGASVLGDAVWMIGGGEGGPGQEKFVARVRRANFGSDGKLGEFVEMTPLPIARAHVHQAPIFNGKVYSVGGRLQNALSSMDRVFVGTFAR